MKVFDMTPLTGKEVSNKRTHYLYGQDIDQKTLLIVGLSLVPGLLLTALFFPLFGMYATFAIPICASSAYMFILGKNRQTGKTKMSVFIDEKIATGRDKAFLFSTKTTRIDPSHCHMYYFLPLSVQVPKKSQEFTPIP
jgi:hypothetical protein